MVHYSKFGISGSWVHSDQNLHLEQKSGSGSRLQQNRPNNGILGPIMVHYSKFGISGSILIKICIWFTNPDLDPDYIKIAQTRWTLGHNVFTSYYLRDLSVQSEDLLRLGPLVVPRIENKRRAADVPRLLCKPVYLKVFAGQNIELTAMYHYWPLFAVKWHYLGYFAVIRIQIFFFYPDADFYHNGPRYT